MEDMDEWELIHLLEDVSEASFTLNQARISCKHRGPYLKHVYEAIHYADSVASDLADALRELQEAAEAGKADKE